jgi:hypothetical protein
MPLQRPWKNLHILVMLILPLWGGIVGGCRSSEPSPRVMCSDCDAPRSFVRSQARVPKAESGTVCGPSVRLTTEEWKTILQSIRVQPKGQGFVFGSSKGAVEPAFAARRDRVSQQGAWFGLSSGPSGRHDRIWTDSYAVARCGRGDHRRMVWSGNESSAHPRELSVGGEHAKDS